MMTNPSGSRERLATKQEFGTTDAHRWDRGHRSCAARQGWCFDGGRELPCRTRTIGVHRRASVVPFPCLAACRTAPPVDQVCMSFDTCRVAYRSVAARGAARWGVGASRWASGCMRVFVVRGASTPLGIPRRPRIGPGQHRRPVAARLCCRRSCLRSQRRAARLGADLGDASSAAVACSGACGIASGCAGAGNGAAGWAPPVRTVFGG